MRGHELLIVAAAQQEPRPKDLPGAPAPKPEQTPDKRDTALKATFEILGRRSVFFPDLPRPALVLWSGKQELELFAD